MKVVTKSLEETGAAAATFVELVLKEKRGGATLIALQGDLGAGKTAFAQGIAAALGVTTSVVSPTFVLQKIYELPQTLQTQFSHLIHIDAYRMERERELSHIGFHEIMQNPSHLICIEWPEVVANAIPADAITVRCTFIDEITHSYEIVFPSHE